MTKIVIALFLLAMAGFMFALLFELYVAENHRPVRKALCKSRSSVAFASMYRSRIPRITCITARQHCFLRS